MVTVSTFTFCLCPSKTTPVLISPSPSPSLMPVSSLIKNLFLYSSTSPKPRKDFGGFTSSSVESIDTKLLLTLTVVIIADPETTGDVVTALLLVEITDVLIDREPVVVIVVVIDDTVAVPAICALSIIAEADTDNGESSFESGTLIEVEVEVDIPAVVKFDGLATAVPEGVVDGGTSVVGGGVDAAESEG